MKTSVAGVLTLLAILIAPMTTSAKGETVRIVITGASLAAPLEITAPDVVDKFSIWTGPGVRIDGQSAYQDANMQSGAFVDWPKGAIGKPPKGLPRYEVSVFCVFPRDPGLQRRSIVQVGRTFSRSIPCPCQRSVRTKLMARLNEAIDARRFEIPIAAEYSLADAAKAHGRLAAGHVLGKLVLRVR
jgi:hypothetical protein